MKTNFDRHDHHQFKNIKLVPTAINGVWLGWIKPWQLLPFCQILVKDKTMQIRNE